MINWGNAVTDEAEKDRILAAATAHVDRNEAGSGLGANMYAPGNSREQAIAQMAYSLFPQGSSKSPPPQYNMGYTPPSATTPRNPSMPLIQPAAATGGDPSRTSLYQSPADLTGRQFTGHAPGATPYGNFVAPTPGALSAAGKFRLDEGLKARQRSAAARGSLFNTGTLKELERFGSGLASQEYDNDFNRALAVYNANKDTNQQNFGQSTTQFRGDLDIFGANNRTGLDWASFDRAGQPRTDVNLMSSGGNVSSGGMAAPTYADDYAASVAAARAQNAAIDDMLRRPLAQTPTPWAPKVHRPQGG